MLSNFANSGSRLLHDKRWREQQSPWGFQNREVVERRDTQTPSGEEPQLIVPFWKQSLRKILISTWMRCCRSCTPLVEVPRQG